ncbi:hypothetical protein ATK17_3833 [Branchiibius hedensis]|uniref:Uncharacterized protein n=1 Tax=Branchiibius hedensis TaxID=672460 RepID=A0A2Y9BMS2_9MICO|nr:hypothetical protein [Branchiibius hedensis]PWJ23339.1 hypothetical protein ATK17_3833 [Branchiibius hedensis]SSA59028.1 hypothetical protein SAMN04489750_3833 [Branchiibius hedensis]
MTEITQHSLNYPDVLDAPPHVALRMGVEGQDPAANQARLATAERIVEQAHAASDQAYASAHWMDEPDIPEPRIRAGVGGPRRRHGQGGPRPQGGGRSP